MTAAEVRLRWGRIVLAGAFALLAGVLVIMLVVAGYAFKLGFEARGAPDHARIQQFAERVGSVAGPIAAILSTLLAAAWAARGAAGKQVLHGTLVGALVACAGLAFAGGVRFSSIVNTVLVLLAGYAGGKIAARPRASPQAPLERKGSPR